MLSVLIVSQESIDFSLSTASEIVVFHTVHMEMYSPVLVSQVFAATVDNAGGILPVEVLFTWEQQSLVAKYTRI